MTSTSSVSSLNFAGSRSSTFLKKCKVVCKTTGDLVRKAPVIRAAFYKEKKAICFNSPQDLLEWLVTAKFLKKDTVQLRLLRYETIESEGRLRLQRNKVPENKYNQRLYQVSIADGSDLGDKLQQIVEQVIAEKWYLYWCTDALVKEISALVYDSMWVGWRYANIREGRSPGTEDNYTKEAQKCWHALQNSTRLQGERGKVHLLGREENENEDVESLFLGITRSKSSFSNCLDTWQGIHKKYVMNLIEQLDRDTTSMIDTVVLALSATHDTQLVDVSDDASVTNGSSSSAAINNSVQKIQKFSQEFQKIFPAEFCNCMNFLNEEEKKEITINPNKTELEVCNTQIHSFLEVSGMDTSVKVQLTKLLCVNENDLSRSFRQRRKHVIDAARARLINALAEKAPKMRECLLGVLDVSEEVKKNLESFRPEDFSGTKWSSEIAHINAFEARLLAAEKTQKESLEKFEKLATQLQILLGAIKHTGSTKTKKGTRLFGDIQTTCGNIASEYHTLAGVVFSPVAFTACFLISDLIRRLPSATSKEEKREYKSFIEQLIPILQSQQRGFENMRPQMLEASSRDGPGPSQSMQFDVAAHLDNENLITFESTS